MNVGIAPWRPRLPAASREWLVQHDGEPLPPDVRADVVAAGGPGDLVPADEQVDWIEAVANGEEPGVGPRA